MIIVLYFYSKVNGDVNVAAVEQAKKYGSKRFVYISVNSLVPAALGGFLPAYFEGKHQLLFLI